jgi:hypothetical protein
VITAQDPTLFIGSSSEGLEVAEYLQDALDNHCEVTVWNQGVFGLGGTGIDSLIQAASSYDFAALVLTPDDVVAKRGQSRPAARDNVLFEAGLFIGALGLERTFLVSRRDHRIPLPTDLDGVTRATYKRRQDGKLRAALAPVGLKIRERLAQLGPREEGGTLMAAPTPPTSAISLAEEQTLLDQELDSLSTSAQAQGWTLKTRSKTAYRVVAPDGRRFSLPLGDPRVTRADLRPYATDLAKNGLRLSRVLVTPVNEAPPSDSVRAKEKHHSRSTRRTRTRKRPGKGS